MGVDFLGFAYAATVAAGGIMGYAKAGELFALFIILSIFTELMKKLVTLRLSSPLATKNYLRYRHIKKM